MCLLYQDFLLISIIDRRVAHEMSEANNKAGLFDEGKDQWKVFSMSLSRQPQWFFHLHKNLCGQRATPTSKRTTP